MHAAADEAEAELGPASARHLRDQAVEVERRRELTTRRVKHIREQIAWRKKALKC
jgi:hypothetical protein